MQLLRYLLLVSLCVASSLSALGGWAEGRAEGWAWYEERRQVEPDITLPEAERASTVLERYRKELEESLAQALLSPTEENVVSYMRLQQRWIEQSAQFAGEWARALLQYPGLDHTASSVPVSQYGLQFHNHQLIRKREAIISALTEEHGLFLFYRGADPASRSFQRVVHELTRKYDWTVLAISVDGVEIDGFALQRQDNGISATFQVEVLPALYVVSPTEQAATPISFGLTSVDQIEQNIFLQFGGAG